LPFDRQPLALVPHERARNPALPTPGALIVSIHRGPRNALRREAEADLDVAGDVGHAEMAGLR
jgi:hypothetical protein